MNMLPPAEVMPYTGWFADRPHFKNAPACGKAADGRVSLSKNSCFRYEKA